MELLKSKFEQCTIGPLKKRGLETAFAGSSAAFLMGRINKLLFTLRMKSSCSSIIESRNEKILKITYPAKRFGPVAGAQWKVLFPTRESAFLKYKIFIPRDFDFVKGGKLPGLAGGKGNTGGEVPSGYDGWSVRFMFKEEGRLCAYLYYPDMPQKFGEKIFLTSNENFFFLPKGEWIELGLQVVMNRSGKRDGGIRCYVNDDLKLSLEKFKFRKTENLKIDHLLFNTFFGGADGSYAPQNESHLLFKDFFVFDIEN
jgi:hypothetical protein